jgi:hypothetical protein
VGLFDLFESGGGVVQGLIPRCFNESTIFANERFGQSLRVLQLPLIYGIGLGGNGGDCLTVQYLQIEPTATTTVSASG